MKTRRPVTINGTQYPADAVVERKGQHYIAHDLARKLKRQARGTPAEVFEPMRNARGEIVDPVFNGEVA